MGLIKVSFLIFIYWVMFFYLSLSHYRFKIESNEEVVEFL